jgi:hypothetical protein
MEIRKEINGTFYSVNTPIDVIEILESSRLNKTRIFLEYGDTKTGKGWGDVYDVTGHVGRSTGVTKIPLLIHNQRSHGGGAILDHCIVSIVTAKGKRSLYSHPNYVTGRV